MDYKNSKWEYDKDKNVDYEAIKFLMNKSLWGIIDSVYRDKKGEIMIDRVKFSFRRNGTGDISYIFDAMHKAKGLKKKDIETLSKIEEKIEKNEIPIIEVGDIYSF